MRQRIDTHTKIKYFKDNLTLLPEFQPDVRQFEHVPPALPVVRGAQVHTSQFYISISNIGAWLREAGLFGRSFFFYFACRFLDKSGSLKPLDVMVIKEGKKGNQPCLFIIIIGRFKINIRDKNFLEIQKNETLQINAIYYFVAYEKRAIK
jgi:hypothetical protein